MNERDKFLTLNMFLGILGGIKHEKKNKTENHS